MPPKLGRSPRRNSKTCIGGGVCKKPCIIPWTICMQPPRIFPASSGLQSIVSKRNMGICQAFRHVGNPYTGFLIARLSAKLSDQAKKLKREGIALPGEELVNDHAEYRLIGCGKFKQRHA